MPHPEAKSFKQLTISVEKLPASTAQQERLTSYAAERARLLLGCYRTGEANDPETYVAAIGAVLSRYPEQVITEVTHPVTGLPKDKNWLPTVKEVHDACEAAAAPIHNRQRFARIVAETMAERAEVDTRPPRPTREELEARYGRNWGLTSLDEPERKPKPAPTAEELKAHYEKFNLAFKPKEESGPWPPEL